ncbi:hypothetical protein [Romboutsia sp. 1001713B170207_170306_H8]|uniref:hypothetical protein n=1 Tax=Romboutsia sp. 1001713B170207_170306_H8 TaxID=2787112 RepID=UPI00082234AF|nr:hypothetical protein [Romboutsia sp. 1001713B170207_170306_H8]SCH47172.1 cxxc_20_cxxc protein [uncultured Clostridium sp.]
MKTCTQCNNKFTFIDRLKFLFNGHLKCTHCNADYRSEANIYRGIYIFTILMLNIFIFNYVIILNDFLEQTIVQVLIITITFPLFDLLPNRWQKYKRVN